MYWVKERMSAHRFICDRCRETVYDVHIRCRYPVCPFCGVSKKGTKVRIDHYPFYKDVRKENT